MPSANSVSSGGSQGTDSSHERPVAFFCNIYHQTTATGAFWQKSATPGDHNGSDSLERRAKIILRSLLTKGFSMQ